MTPELPVSVNAILGPDAVPERLVVAICDRLEILLKNDKLQPAQHLAIMAEARAVAELADDLRSGPSVTIYEAHR